MSDGNLKFIVKANRQRRYFGVYKLFICTDSNGAIHCVQERFFNYEPLLKYNKSFICLDTLFMLVYKKTRSIVQT